MAIPDAAAEHYRAEQQLQAVVLASARRSWRRIDPRFISESWTEQLAFLLPVIISGQQRAAFEGATYAAMTLAEQGEYVAPTEFANPAAFGGYASDGRNLDTLMQAPAIATTSLLGGGATTDAALALGMERLSRIVVTQIADAGRQAGGVDIAARPGVGYTRMVSAKACSRCIVLAGRFYRWNKGFLRHPQCFPAGVVASGPSIEGATRRWFEGELVVLATASGQNLPLTGNHPVLTSRGWIPANLIQEGDEVVRSTRPQGATSLVVPDHNQVPALVEDVWGALGMHGFDRVPTSPQDFHGDGQYGEVDVVDADGPLRLGLDASVGQHSGKLPLPLGIVAADAFDLQGAPMLVDLGHAAHPASAIGSGNLTLTFGGTLGLGTQHARLAHRPLLYPGSRQNPSDWTTGHAVLLGEAEFARPGKVLLDDLIGGKVEDSPRWDAPGLPLSLESRDGYASQGRDLLKRLSGQVELDRVVKLSRTEFRGHVYSLQSSEGWHTANSLIVSNCLCKHVARKVGDQAEAFANGYLDDPYEAFGRMSAAEQDRTFGVANAQAIRDGADISQVVNSKRGMTANGTFTVEGTSRQGNAGTLLKPGQRRLTPEGIYDQAARFGKDRAWTMDRLREHGYLLPKGQVPAGALRGQREGYGQLGGGGKRKAAREAIEEARRTGVRDPNNRYTMTAAERRLYDARRRYETALSGVSPYTSPGFGNTPDPYGLGLNAGGVSRRKVTPAELARAEKEYRAYLASGGQIFDR